MKLPLMWAATTLACWLVSQSPLAAQLSSGVSFAFSTNKTLSGNMFVVHKSLRYGLGCSYQFEDQLNTVVDERKSNYGTTPIGQGSYFWLVDLSVGHVFFHKLSLQGELSFGTRKHFTNYRDNRFRDGGYSLVRSKDPLAGAGISVGWLVRPSFELYLGGHTTRKMDFGVRFLLNSTNS